MSGLGKPRSLTDEQVAEIYHSWAVNDDAWQAYRRNPIANSEPINLKFADLAVRFRVSPGVISDVLHKRGAYTELSEGLRVSKRSVSDAGSCNFCNRMHRMVYELKGSNESCTLVVRLCSKCIGELKKKT